MPKCPPPPAKTCGVKQKKFRVFPAERIARQSPLSNLMLLPSPNNGRHFPGSTDIWGLDVCNCSYASMPDPNVDMKSSVPLQPLVTQCGIVTKFFLQLLRELLLFCISLLFSTCRTLRLRPWLSKSSTYRSLPVWDRNSFHLDCRILLVFRPAPQKGHIPWLQSARQQSCWRWW